MKNPISFATRIKAYDIGVANVTNLLFEWPIRKAPRLALPFFIFFAALLHLSTIYIFNIVYEPPHTSKVTTAQVFFLLPESQASQQMALWLQANDPAVFSPLKTIQYNQPKIPETIYQLSQSTPSLHSLPHANEDILTSLLPPINELVLPKTLLSPLHSSTPQEVIVAPPISKTTTVEPLEELALRAPIPISNLGYPLLPPGISTPKYPTMLTVNIDSLGIPRHVIITQSSQNDAADQAATEWLMKSRFVPAKEGTWGPLLIYWGNK
jgi:hypothetical protein